MSSEDRFMQFVSKVGECWLWSGFIDPKGYARFSIGVEQFYAHRWAYEHWTGEIPNGLQIDHLCRNRSCVNPAHLDAVTGGENVRRGENHNRVKNACPKNHPYDAGNTYVSPEGGRICKTCRREGVRAIREVTGRL